METWNVGDRVRFTGILGSPSRNRVGDLGTITKVETVNDGGYIYTRYHITLDAPFGGPTSVTLIDGEFERA